MATIVETITIKIREDGSRAVSRNIERIGAAAEGAEAQLSDLQSVIGGLITAATLTSLVRMADEFTNLQNRLRLVTTGTANLARITKELGNIANSTRSDFTATAELYARMATSSKELGLSQQELLDFTKSLNQAVILSGASAEEAAGGIRQLSQGMASGTLRGDELNSVLENLPAVADIIAKGLGVTRGELRKMGQDGQLTATQIVDAFKLAKDELEAGFATTVPTVGQSLTVLRNNFILWLGDLDKSYGITQGLAKAIMLLANNLNILVPILAGVGVAMGVAFSAALVQKFIVQIRLLWALMLANPFVAVAAVITGLVTTLFLMRDQIKLGIDETTTLGDLMRAAWESILPMIQGVADAAAAFFSWLSGTSAGTFNELLNQTVGYQHESEAVWLKLLRVVAQVFDMIGAVIRGTMAGVHAVIMSFIAAWMNNFKQLGNAIDAIKELDGDKLKAAITSNLDGYKAAAVNAGSAFSDAFQAEVLSQSRGGLESVLDGWIARAQEIGKGRQGGEGALAGAGAAAKPVMDPKAVEKAAEKAAGALQRLRGELDSLLGSINPVTAAKQRLAEAQDILNRSVAAGLITEKEATAVYEEMAFQLRDQIDPLAALNRQLDESISLLKMSNAERQIESQMMQETQRLRLDGVKLTQEEIDQLRAKLVVEQELARISQLRDQVEAESMEGQLQRARDMAKALQGMTGLTKGDRFSVLNNMLGGSLEDTQSEFDARLEQFQLYYETIDIFRQQDVISEQMAAEAKKAIKQQEMDLYVDSVANGLGQVAQLMSSNNKKAFKIGQAAAIAQVAVKTPQAAMDAYSSLAGIPYVGPFLGAAAAAAAVVMGMQQISKIRSQQPPQFRTGGTYTIGGNGGVDSQMVAFRGTPGEQVSINTPSQARAMERIATAMEDGHSGGSRSTRPLQQNITVVQTGKPDNRTPVQNARAMRKGTQKLLRVKMVD